MRTAVRLNPRHKGARAELESLSPKDSALTSLKKLFRSAPTLHEGSTLVLMNGRNAAALILRTVRVGTTNQIRSFIRTAGQPRE